VAKIAVAVDTALIAAVKALNGAGDGVRRFRDDVEASLLLGGLPDMGLGEGVGVRDRVQDDEGDGVYPGTLRNPRGSDPGIDIGLEEEAGKEEWIIDSDGASVEDGPDVDASWASD